VRLQRRYNKHTMNVSFIQPLMRLLVARWNCRCIITSQRHNRQINAKKTNLVFKFARLEFDDSVKRMLQEKMCQACVADLKYKTVSLDALPPPHGQWTDSRKSIGIPLPIYLKSTFHLAMTLTFVLWPWQPLQQCPLTCLIFMPSFIEIPPLDTEISRHAK